MDIQDLPIGARMALTRIASGDDSTANAEHLMRTISGLRARGQVALAARIDQAWQDAAAR